MRARHYVGVGDAQNAAAFFLVFAPLLPGGAEASLLLPPPATTALLATYHDALAARALHPAAAALRRRCYPAFPLVVAGAVADNRVRVRVGRGSAGGGKGGQGAGEKGGKAPCPVCDTPCARGGLLALCLRCGHGGHLGCLRGVWGAEGVGGYCVAGGCGCACLGGG